MKRIFLVVAAVVIFLPIRGQFRYGLQGGVNLATLVAKNYSNNAARNLFRPGFNAGPFAEFALGAHVSLKSALILETKGTNATYRSDSLKLDGSTSLLYLDLPLLIKVNYNLGSVSVFVNAGPYAGTGLTGTGKFTSPFSSTSRKIRWGSGYQDDFKRLDYGIAGGAGFGWKAIFLEGIFEFGMANIYPLTQTNYIVRHRVIGLRLGYFFGK